MGEDEGIVFMDDNNIRMSTSVSAKYPTHSKSLNVDTQLINKRASMTKSKSAQNVNEKYKHKETDTENVYIINQNGKKTKASKRKKKRKQANKASSPRTPMFGRLSHSYSVDTHQIREQTPTPIDAFATLNNYFSLNALYAESDGSNSDSMDMQQYHHHAREESLAQTFDSCEVIPALQSVQQKITPYIGTTEKWKPINHELTPDHGDCTKSQNSRKKKAMSFDEEENNNLHHSKPKNIKYKSKKRTKSSASKISRSFLKNKEDKVNNDTICSQQSNDSISSLYMKQNMNLFEPNDAMNHLGIGLIEEYDAMTILDYDEDDDDEDDDDDDDDTLFDINNLNGSQNVGALFNHSKFVKKENVVLRELNGSHSVELLQSIDKPKSIKIKNRSKRSQSLLTGSSNATQKLKQQNDTKLKLKAIERSNEYVESKEMTKNTKTKGKKKKSCYAKKYKRKNKKKELNKNKCWKQEIIHRTSTM